jgi:predicted nucleic acid-binding protein
MAQEGLTLDSGALIAHEKGNRFMAAVLKRALTRNAILTVPAPVLAQVWRGNSARIAMLLKACIIETFDELAARQTGRLLGESRTSDVVDGAVVVSALKRQDSVVTSDPGDIERLAAGRLTVVPL